MSILVSNLCLEPSEAKLIQGCGHELPDPLLANYNPERNEHRLELGCCNDLHRVVSFAI